MKHSCQISFVLLAMALAGSAFSQETTLARLNHDATSDISLPSRATRTNSTAVSERRTIALSDSALSRLAANDLFVHSNLNRASWLAHRAWQRDPRDAEALFVQMEVAGMRADQATVLDSAIRLCELGTAASGDPRVRLAAVRVRELAANTPEFRKVIPRLRSLLASSQESWPELNAALLDGAMDGIPGLNPYALSRAAGVVTDWRIVGPMGRNVPLDFDPSPATVTAALARVSYENHPVENFQFPDGRITLPDYLPHRGTFYAVAQFASLTAGNWTVNAENAGTAEVFIDGQCVLQQVLPRSAANYASGSFDVAAGPHRVLVKFVGSVTPLRISISKATPQVHIPAPAGVSLQELTYDLAVELYAAGEFETAIQRISASLSSGESAALQFLLAQSWSQLSPMNPAAATAWQTLHSLAPTALAADVALGKRALTNGNLTEAAKLASRVLATRAANVAALEILAATRSGGDDADLTAENNEDDIWSRRLTAHPSCEGLQGAIRFYLSQGRSADAKAAQQRLDGCAPEATDYAQSLSEQGSHAQAAQSLRRLLTAAPLNRAALLMLVRELQMAGDDAGAQRAAAEWLRIAPNADNYHRLAANLEAEISVGTTPEAGSSRTAEFYLPYRRDAIQAARQTAGRQFAGAAVVLFDDHVAIARPDGSISLYVHTATRLPSRQRVQEVEGGTIPPGAQHLMVRVIHPDGTFDAIEDGLADSAISSGYLAAGDVLDQEYVVHYAGDGGIQEHSEVFQFVFGSFNWQVLSAQFVALTPADHADRGVVIATGEAPRMQAHIHDGMLARVWQQDIFGQDTQAIATSSKGLAIIRIVEEENGWTEPSKAEHQRRIETIHPGPRFQDSSVRIPHSKHYAHQL